MVGITLRKAKTVNSSIKTYGVVINMDYANHPVTKCKELWNKIAQKMLHNEFRIEKRMFLITTRQNKENIYAKAINILESIDTEIPSDNNRIYYYLKDFFTFDMTEHIDLRSPNPRQGIDLIEESVEQIELQ